MADDSMEEVERDNQRLVLRAQAGEAGAFSRLIVVHERRALAAAYAVVGCAATAADVVQDAMLRAWQRLAELDDPARFAPWLCRIVRNLAVDTLRRSPRARADLEALAGVPVRDDDTTGGDETRERLSAALAQLDDLTRLAVTLRYYDDLSSKQIGELVGLSPAAIDMRLSRARGLLREQLSCLFPEDGVACAAAATRHGGAS